MATIEGFVITTPIGLFRVGSKAAKNGQIWSVAQGGAIVTGTLAAVPFEVFSRSLHPGECKETVRNCI